MKSFLFLVFILGYSLCFGQVPEGFVDASKYIPNLEIELRYFGYNNFVGRPIHGYDAHILYLTKPTAQALRKVQKELERDGLCLKIYDGYRPQRAVNMFMTWAQELNDTLKKNTFYPQVKKKNLFKEGYIASKSGHSRGSTVDVTVVDLKTGEPLDMGSPYDFFGLSSWVDYDQLTEEQKSNRRLLQMVMQRNGFKNYSKEWWHFTLKNEPFPNTYFDFIIK